MQDDGEFSAHHDGMSYRSLLPPIPHLINEGRTTCVCIVKVLMEEFFVSQKVLSYLFYFRPDSSMDILRKIVFKKLKLRYYYLVELLPYFFIR